MPSILGGIDKLGVRFTGTETTEQKIQLLDAAQTDFKRYLLYALSHLDSRNFTEGALDVITDPIYAKIRDQEGNLAELALEAQGLKLQLSNAEGQINSLWATAQGLAAEIVDAEGNITSLQATATGLQTQVTNLKGDVSKVTQTAEGLDARVSKAEGEISSLTLTASGLSTKVSNAEGEISSLTQTVNSFSLSVSNGEDSSVIKLMANGVAVSSKTIQFRGTVLFSDLDGSSGTIIDGGAIDTDTLYLDSLYGSEVYIRDYRGAVAAVLTTSGASSWSGRALYIESGAIELNAAFGDVYLESGGGAALQVRDDDVGILGDLNPMGGGRDLGSMTRWSDIYLDNQPDVLSDRNAKFDIDYDLSCFDGLFDQLRPCAFRLTYGESLRLHMGLIAQDVEAARDQESIPSTELAALVKSEAGAYSLRYGEFIGLLIWQVQQLKKRVAALEGQKG